MWQQAIVFHLVVDAEEAGRQKSLFIFRQVLINLRLILPGDGLVMRLPSLLARRNSCGAIRLPPMFAGNGLVLLVDDHTNVVGPPRPPQSVTVLVQHFELNERATKADA